MRTKCLKYELTVLVLTAIALLAFVLSLKNISTYRKDIIMAGRIMDSKSTPKRMKIIKRLACSSKQMGFFVKGVFSPVPVNVSVTRRKDGIYLVNVTSGSLLYSAIMKGFGTLLKFFSVHVDSMCMGNECGKNRVNITFELGLKHKRKNSGGK